MEKHFQSVALIQQSENDQIQFLLRRQASQSQWEFIVADRLNQESFRESVTREVAWQLELNRKTDFLVSSMAQLSMEFVETSADETQAHTAIAFYNIHIYRQAVIEQLNEDPVNRWVSAAEVCNGSTIDGQSVDPRVVAWINKWSVVQPWQ